MGEFSPPPPFFLSPLLSFFSYPSNIEIIFDFSYIIRKIHPPFQYPGSALGVEEEKLASQKPSCDGGERRKPTKRNAATTTKTSQPRKKSTVSNFFSLFAVYSTAIWYFSREEAVLKIDLLGKWLTRGISEDRSSPCWAPGWVTNSSLLW